MSLKKAELKYTLLEIRRSILWQRIEAYPRTEGWVGRMEAAVNFHWGSQARPAAGGAYRCTLCRCVIHKRIGLRSIALTLPSQGQPRRYPNSLSFQGDLCHEVG